MDFSFFMTDKKSGYKTKESWLKKTNQIFIMKL